MEQNCKKITRVQFRFSVVWKKYSPIFSGICRVKRENETIKHQTLKTSCCEITFWVLRRVSMAIVTYIWIFSWDISIWKILRYWHSLITGEVYLNIIEQFVALLEETDLCCWFQQDNAQSHVARDTMAVLKSFFNDRLISSGLWPPRSPDLSPLDYFLWGYLKDQVYSPEPATFEDLKVNIVCEIDRIPFSMLERVIHNVIKHAQACILGASYSLNICCNIFCNTFSLLCFFFPLNF